MAVALDPSDPYYLQNSALAKQLAGLVENFGLYANGTSPLTDDYAKEFNLDPTQVAKINATAAGNTNSVQQTLAQQLAGNNTQIQRTSNAHGLFSGANVAATAHEVQAAGTRNYQAGQSIQQQLAGLQTTDIGNLSDATGRAAALAAADQTVPAAPAAAPAAAAATPAALPPISTIGVANMNGDPRTGTSLYQPLAPKPPKALTPKISLGHV